MVLLLLNLLACQPVEPPPFGVITADDGEDTGQAEERDPTVWLRDNWSEAVVACSLPDEYLLPEGSNIVDVRFEPCGGTLRSHIGLDQDSFPNAQAAVWSQYMLFDLAARNLGTVDDLDALDSETAQLVRPPLIEELKRVAEVTGRPEVEAALYNLITSSIEKTVYISEEDLGEEDLDFKARVDFDTRVLYVTFYVNEPYWDTGLIFMHEAAHLWLDRPHVVCPVGTVAGLRDWSGDFQCDSDWRGAHGFATGLVHLLARDMPQEIIESDSDYFRGVEDALKAEALILAE